MAEQIRPELFRQKPISRVVAFEVEEAGTYSSIGRKGFQNISCDFTDWPDLKNVEDCHCDWVKEGDTGGGFATNHGGRVYTEIGDQIEYCSPEMRNKVDILNEYFRVHVQAARVAGLMKKKDDGEGYMQSSVNLRVGDLQPINRDKSTGFHLNLCGIRSNEHEYKDLLPSFIATFNTMFGSGMYDIVNGRFVAAQKALTINNSVSIDKTSNKPIILSYPNPHADNGWFRVEVRALDFPMTPDHLILTIGLISAAMRIPESGSSSIKRRAFELMVDSPVEVIKATSQGRPLKDEIKMFDDKARRRIELIGRWLCILGDMDNAGHLSKLEASAVKLANSAYENLRNEDAGLDENIIGNIKREAYIKRMLSTKNKKPTDYLLAMFDLLADRVSGYGFRENIAGIDTTKRYAFPVPQNTRAILRHHMTKTGKVRMARWESLFLHDSDKHVYLGSPYETRMSNDQKRLIS